MALDGFACGMNERQVEVPWLRSHLRLAGRILDIGSRGAIYLEDLRATGAAVTLCDLQPVSASGRFSVFRGDVRKLPGDWTGLFDLVTAVSSLDHVGLKEDGSQEHPDALAEAERELHRVLKPLGRLLVTVPAGKDTWTTHPDGGQRVFSLGALQDLFSCTRWVPLDTRMWKLSGDWYLPATLAEIKRAGYGDWRAEAVVALELQRRAA